MVALWTAGVRYPSRVHHLVAAAFHGTRPPGAEIRHLNGDRSDNRASNLLYGTVAENRRDTARHGRCHFSNGGVCHRGHPIAGVNSTLGGGCKACHRAYCRVSYAASKGQTLDIQVEADISYRSITQSG